MIHARIVIYDDDGVSGPLELCSRTVKYDSTGHTDPAVELQKALELVVRDVRRDILRVGLEALRLQPVP